jgi:hypothetical protein
MEFINYMRNAFSSDYARDEGKLLSEKPIERSEEYNMDYIDWLMTNKYQSMLQDIYRAFQNAGKPIDRRDPCITFLMIPTIHGFTLHEEDCRWSQDDMRFLFEYLSHVLEEEFAYEQEIAIIEDHKYNDRYESVERYRLDSVEELVDYSSIMLRLCRTNDKITSMKFSAIRTKKRIANLGLLLKDLAEA